MDIIDIFIIDKTELGANEKVVDTFIDIANDISESLETSAMFFTSTESFIHSYNNGLKNLSFRLWIHYMYNKNNPKNSKGYRTANKINKILDFLNINLLTRETNPQSINGYKSYCTDDVIDLIRGAITNIPYNTPYTKYKIFISHSHKDIKIIENFVNKILGNALGFDVNKEGKDIFCTSIENNGIQTGTDFKNVIKENLLNSNIVIIFLSDEYKKSEICQNEMGAVWAFEKEIIPLIIPPMEYDNVGFIMSTLQCVKINSEEGLIKVCSELNKKFELNKDIGNINSSIKSFINELS